MDFLTLANVVSVAFVSSVSHCAGMCGGFAIACGHRLSEKSRAQIFFFGLIYHFARICAYVLLGVAFGFLGSKVIFSVNSKAYVYFFLGLFLAFIGIAVIRRGFLLKILENDKIAQFLSPLFKLATKKYGIYNFILLGFLNGLLPCGVVYYFLAMSFGVANLFESALIMLIFGLCTMPVMLGAWFLAGVLNSEFKHSMNVISGVLMIGYGLYLAFTGFIAIR